MSQSSGGEAPAMSRGRPQSVLAGATHSGAAAFGEDIADDQYSVSELSHAEDDRRARKPAGHPALGAAGTKEIFLRTTLSRAPPGLERLQSCIEDSEARTSTGSNSQASGENGHSGGASTDQTSDVSPDAPFDAFGSDVSTGSDESDPLPSSFALFAKTRFHLKTTHTYCCAALPQPLLAKADKSDFLASLAAWVLILRIMGDLPDVDMGDKFQIAGEQPSVVSRVRASFRHKYSKKEVDESQAKYSELFKDPTGVDTRGLPFMAPKTDTMLQKVQYVCSLGIYRPELRDELYCQLCKQLTNNPSRNSTVRGWVLLALFAGSFAPSERFATCFTHFLREGPPEFSQKVDLLLRRTCAVGTRGYPPSWLEFQAAKNNKPLLVPVMFMNGYRTLCEVDAATTVKEVILNISEKIGLLDCTGYSIYVTLHTKISCLGHGLHRVMDAISECEQQTKQLGMRESSSVWRLFFRREYFTPWPMASGDGVNTDLIYQQVMRGVKLGEYKCEKNEVFVLLAAQFYYIDHQADVTFEKLGPFVENFLAEDSVRKHEAASFVQKVKDALQQNFLVHRPNPMSLKHDTVAFAKDKWFLMFSRFYDTPKVMGPGLALSKVVIALNNKGLYILDDSDTIRMHIAFWEVVSVTKGRQNVTIRTVKADDYLVSTYHSDDFFIVLTSFVNGLRQRSRYAVVIQDVTQQGSAGGAGALTRGDLVVLTTPYSETCDGTQVHGTCKRTGSACSVPRDKIYVVASMDEPSADMLGCVMVQLRKDPTTFMCDVDFRPHTLQVYSRQHFRPVSENTVTKLLQKASLKRDRAESLWQFTRDPLKKPLLKRTCSREDLRRPACRAFSSILQYMKDLTPTQQITDMELANDYVIEPARRNKYLREEIFCQLLKQLTGNPDRSSEDRGWQLMQLMCTTVTPVGELYDQVVGFCSGSKHPVARTCCDLMTNQKLCGSRLYPPHYLEHDMVTKQLPNVRLQLLLPSGTTLTLEAGGRTRVSDLKQEVSRRLQIKSSSEYSLFLSTGDGMHSLPERGALFDFLSHADIYWLRQHAGSRNSVGQMQLPGLVMLKKIWVNATPGDDPQADKVFHFPQEVPNFLRGYHSSPAQQVIQLSALLHRVKFGDDAKNFDKFSSLAPSILPRGFPADQSLDYVKKAVEEEYRNSRGMSEDEARLRFLQIISTWPTYGSVFFEVKQKTSRALPNFCLVAVNIDGVHVMDLLKKDLLRTYEFSKIPNWAFDDNSFTFIISDNGATAKLLFETTVGHNLDDVVMSHISWVMNSQLRRKHGFFNNAGESVC